jgi:hypothetical protein
MRRVVLFRSDQAFSSVPSVPRSSRVAFAAPLDERPVQAEVRRHGVGITRSLQIFRARKSFISRCRGGCRRLPRCAIDVYGVAPSLAQQRTAMEFKMANEVEPLHSLATTSGSRITSRPWIDSSDRARFASITSSSASARLSRASSSVTPWVLAPGTSSTKPTYPSGTFWNTAVSFTTGPPTSSSAWLVYRRRVYLTPNDLVNGGPRDLLIRHDAHGPSVRPGVRRKHL